MSFRKLCTTAILFTLMTTSVLATGRAQKKPVQQNDSARCDRFVRGVFKLERQVDRLERDVHIAKNRHHAVKRRLDDREAALVNRRSNLSNSQNTLNSLRYDYNNGPRLVGENSSTISSLNANMPGEIAKIAPLKKKYKAISKWRAIKRAKAKKKYKNQVKRVDNLKYLVVRHTNDINRLNDIQDNFGIYEPDAEDRVFDAQDQLQRQRSMLPTIRTLAVRADLAHEQLRNAKYAKKTHVDRLKNMREKLVHCRAQ